MEPIEIALRIAVGLSLLCMILIVVLAIREQRRK